MFTRSLSFEQHVRMVIPKLAEPLHQQALLLIMEKMGLVDTEADLIGEISRRFNLTTERARQLAEQAAEALLSADPSLERWWDVRLGLS